jgi:transposase InsO family protein
MQIKSNYKGVRGAITMYNRVLRWRGMNEKEIERRLHIIDYAYKYVERLCAEAFKISKRTIWRYKKLLKEAQGQIIKLNPKSRKPKTFRKREIPNSIIDKILQLRKEHPRLGKKKVHALIKKEYKDTTPSVATVGRIIYDLKQRGLLPKNERLSLNGRTGKLSIIKRKKQIKQRKQKGEEVFQVDTIIRHFSGCKLYTLTGIDTKTRIAFAKCYTTHKSIKTKDFIDYCFSQFPIKKVQTDNGSEFAKYFKESLKEKQVTHYHTYPRCPKMNAFVERFNRTLSEEFLEINKYIALSDLDKLNTELSKYMAWYNTERPHESLNLLSPKEYVLQLEREDRCV